MVKYIPKYHVPEVFSFSHGVISESRVELEIQIFLIILFITFGIFEISRNKGVWSPSLCVVEWIRRQLKSQGAGLQLSASCPGGLDWRMPLPAAGPRGLHVLSALSVGFTGTHRGPAVSCRDLQGKHLRRVFLRDLPEGNLLSEDFLGFKPVHLFSIKNNHALPQTF